MSPAPQGIVFEPIPGLEDRLLRMADNDRRRNRGSAPGPESQAWSYSLPLVADMDGEPYPTKCLPGYIGQAVGEVAEFVQCPVALAACSALSALSVAAQGLANVRRGGDLVGPVSLSLLAVAESGERKSECDRRFAEGLTQWQLEQVDAIKPDVDSYRAAVATWEAEHEATRNAIKQARKAGEGIEDLRRQLEALEGNKPRPVRMPRILLESETAEALAWNLAKLDGWPTAGILSSEAGVVFGGHAMRRDTLMQSLSLLNKLWSGEPHRVGRRTSESFDLVGARLTLGLAVQPETVRAFLAGSEGLARGTGFLARMLIAWPDSTQGTRLYREAPIGWPGLTRYRARLRQLLDLPLPMEDGRLSPPALGMTPEAFEGWRQFHDMVETALRQGGELSELRDVGSKAPENVARLAALFHLFENGASGLIGPDCIQAAGQIISWHLLEARRFLGDVNTPEAVRRAIRLDDWLVAKCRETDSGAISLRDVLRFGPNPVRRRAEAVRALEELASCNRAKLAADGRTVLVNPELWR